MSTPRLILASSSPRRIELLREAGYTFEVDPPREVEEIQSPDLTGREIARWNAMLKARAVAARRGTGDEIILAADTVVTLGGRVYGKPANFEEAVEMLCELQGHTHLVFTGVCLARGAALDLFDVSTAVTFRSLTETEIRNYLGLIDPLDKAGAYAAQEYGDQIIAHLEGSASNVMGLPMEAVCAHLPLRRRIGSGSPWEARVGYSRALRVGQFVYVAGTTATDAEGRVVAPRDAAGQTRFILQKIEAALQRAGATREDVVRTRMFVTDISHWESIGQVHGEFFGSVRPAATMVEVSRLIDPEHLLEIEVEAVVDAAAVGETR